MEAALRQKADTREVEMWLQSKAGLTEMSSQLELLGAELARGLDGKVTQPELNHACEQLEGRMASEMNAVESAMQQLSSRTAVDSAMSSLEKKANIDDINRSLTEARAGPVRTRQGPASPHLVTRGRCPVGR
jgi:hypothetical protein